MWDGVCQWVLEVQIGEFWFFEAKLNLLPADISFIFIVIVCSQISFLSGGNNHSTEMSDLSVKLNLNVRWWPLETALENRISTEGTFSSGCRDCVFSHISTAGLCREELIPFVFPHVFIYLFIIIYLWSIYSKRFSIILLHTSSQEPFGKNLVFLWNLVN